MSRCGHQGSSSEECHHQTFSAKDVTAHTSGTKNKLAKLQKEDTALEECVNLKDAARKGDYEIKYEKRRGILYRIRSRVDGLGECSKQTMVPKTLRKKVMEVAHDSIFGGHPEINKTLVF